MTASSVAIAESATSLDDVVGEDDAKAEEDAKASDESMRLLPEFSQVVLSNGIKVSIFPLKARQFFKLMRIMTRGGSILMMTALVNDFGNMTVDEFASQLVGLLLYSVPEAPEATFEFLYSMIDMEPFQKSGKDGFEWTKEGQAINALLNDPELEDVMTIIQQVVEDNKHDLSGLGKKIKSLFAVAEKTGQLKTTTPKTTRSSGRSRTSST